MSAIYYSHIIAFSLETVKKGKQPHKTTNVARYCFQEACIKHLMVLKMTNNNILFTLVHINNQILLTMCQYNEINQDYYEQPRLLWTKLFSSELKEHNYVNADFLGHLIQLISYPCNIILRTDFPHIKNNQSNVLKNLAW